MRRMIVRIDDWIWPAILGSERPETRPVVGLPADARCVGVHKELNHLVLSFESAEFAEVEDGALYPELNIMFMAVDPSPAWVDSLTESLRADATEAAESRSSIVWADMGKGKPTERADAPDKPDAGGPRPAERADAPDRPGNRTIPTVPPRPSDPGQPAKSTQPDT